MARHQILNGVQVALSKDEEDARDAEEKKWADGEVARNAMAEIHRLEGEITIRRLREAYKDSTWMDAQDALIKTQRDKL